MFQTDIHQQLITIEGKTYSHDDLKLLSTEDPEMFSDFQFDIFRFLEEWFNNSDKIIIYTSGSTGKPKPIVVQKMNMINSAIVTCNYLDLKPKDKVLLCMPLSFIAGKMMVVRALVAGLDLYPVFPTGNPLNDTEVNFDFAAMVPLQIFNTLRNSRERSRLRKIEKLLIGGGAIDPGLEAKLCNFPNPVFASYGMAETLSHVALRRVNGEEASLNFTPLPSVSISLSAEGTLIIDAPFLSKKRIITNDLTQILPDGRFRILGRKDNVINTGGLKVQIEELELIIKKYISTPFAISSLPDKKFGEMIILVTEQPIDVSIFIKELLPHQIPKKIIQIDSIPHTESGKINRAALRVLIASS